jgi:hypothetical protein
MYAHYIQCAHAPQASSALRCAPSSCASNTPENALGLLCYTVRATADRTPLIDMVPYPICQYTLHTKTPSVIAARMPILRWQRGLAG